jgi:hypothetical protein
VDRVHELIAKSGSAVRGPGRRSRASDGQQSRP